MADNPSLYVISAICGNWWQESTLNPGLYEGRKVVPLTDNNIYGGFGLGQWTNSPKHKVYRRTALANYLAANGYAYNSPDGQLEFFIAENTWYRTAEAANFTGLQDFLHTDNTDLQMLTYAFMRGWEGIWDGTQGVRYQAALDVYAYVQAHEADDPLPAWVISNQYLSNAQRLSNSLLLYHMFNGVIIPGPDPGPGPGPGPGPPAYKSSARKIWKLIRYK